MIAVETVLRKLISEYEFVIIPGFGALLSHHIPAAYDSNSGFFSPPAKKLAFNEYLKLDDGLLANYISRQEKCTHTEAVDYVKGYTDQLRQELDARGQAVIAGVGEFGRNVEGKLVFEPKTEKYFKDEWYGFEKVKVKHFNKQVATKTAAQAFATAHEVEVIEFEDEKVRSINWRRWAAAAVVTLLCGLSFFFVNSQNSDIQSTLNPFKEMFSRSEVPQEQQTTVEEPAPVENNETVVVKEDSGKLELEDNAVTKVDSSAIAVPSPAPVEAVHIASPKFYVIAGAFKGPRQANVLLADLKEKGFENALIIPGNRYSTKVKVAIDSFESEKDAYRASVRLKSVIGQEGWVFKPKTNK
ncbi:SPOR domain-containing protein [Dyadobacter sp. Leaf189]|uniref:HU domain-containing protein n=1 Tax=Dyadobacter sp. Leaf189 TaxID=1736295 RepID=UPI0006F6521E|nr:SPOR domain-containing protein [Dyadobacter sp. Leaf189]KQS28237.1 sporulation protein [Dyadobacter sp. Leaf189]